MSARRSSADPVSAFLETGERIVWRHRPSPRALTLNRLPPLVLILLFIGFGAWMTASFVGGAILSIMAAQSMELWLVVPFGFALFSLSILSAFLSVGWTLLRHFLDSWSTHYALTNRRLLVVSDRGVVDYGPAFFAKMEALRRGTDGHVLLFDWGPSGKHRTENFRDRIAGLPDAGKLEQLIRDTLKPPLAV